MRYRTIETGSRDKLLHSEYSKSQFQKYSSNKKRISKLIEIVDFHSNPDKNSTILSIGPRFESEIFGLRGLGFAWKNIEAIDTYSYSPKIKTGNMHSLPFKNSEFDVIVVGWVLAYSSDPLRAMREFHRVLSDTGKLIITWELPVNKSIKRIEDMSLFRHRSNRSEMQPLSNVDFFKILKNFQIQTFTCTSFDPNSRPNFVALILSKNLK